jgi:signal transduction histidine kinase
MKLYLGSKDEQIKQLCRSVLHELVGTRWALHVANGDADECDADLYVWDTESQLGSERALNAPDKWRHFFLIDRANVETFRTVFRFPDANILLKPLTKTTLVAFLFEACKRCEQVSGATNDGFITTLRADRDEILQCLIQTNLKLQEYDHDRTNFLARAIHDFRAPLTAITGYCGLLLGDDLGDLTAQQREVIERMHRSAKKLSRMAGAMFQLSIAPRVELALDLQDRELRECVHQALDEISPTAQEKHITVELDLEPTAESLLFEPSKVEQVIINLLDNACKFTPRSGTIRVKGYGYFWDRRVSESNGFGAPLDRRATDDRAPNGYRIDIHDSGPGIPRTHLPKIFEEYTSYGGGVDRSGGGLGLAICRMIIQQHKGKIWAESKPEGAVFSFVLPFHREQKPMVPRREALAKAAI